MIENTPIPSHPDKQLELFSPDAETTGKISDNPLESVKNAFDLTCKQAFIQNLEGALKFVGISDKATLIEKNVELQRTSDLKVDLVFWVAYPIESQAYLSGEKFLLHVEFQKQGQKNIPLRMAEYNMELALANTERDNKGGILNYPKIQSYVVYFWPEEGKSDPELCTISDVIEVRYRKILLYEKTLAELKQMELWEYVAFAPILKGINDQQLKEAVDLLEKYAGSDENKRNRLLLTLAFYFKRRYRRNINDIIKGFDTMISKTAESGYYALIPEEARKEREAGIDIGKQEGIEAGRQEILAMLSDAEREKIKQRLGKTTGQKS